MSVLFRSGAMVLLGLAAVAAGCGGSKQSPQDVTRSYLKAKANGDGQRACDLMTASFRRISADAAGAAATVTCEESVARLARLLDAARRDGVANAALADAGSGAKGSAWVRVRSGPLKGELITVRKVDGDWRIASEVSPAG